MKVNLKTTILGGALAIIAATACCWLPVLLVSLGAGTGVIALAEGMQGYNTYIMMGGVFLILIGATQVYRKARVKKIITIIPSSKITCPFCGYIKEEVMPVDACQYFYECKNCNEIMKPKDGDCCVFCSYGNVDCPPIQKGEDCC